MVKIDFKYGLPFCEIDINYKGKTMVIDNVLVDTGSGGTVLKMDIVEKLGITIEKDDVIETISGVGGIEFVYKKKIDSLNLGNLRTNDFIVEVGVMDYGFNINGILGVDFLKNLSAIIDLNKMVIYK